MTPARWVAIANLSERNRIPLAERIAKFSHDPNARGCVEWTGAVDRRGYGRLSIDGKGRAVTHLVLELNGRPRPSPNHIACHSCDNPPCINPDHLWWGTQSDNMKDCFKKGRAHVDGLAVGWRTGRPPKSIRERFEARIMKDGPGDCWLYRGKLTQDGYGSFPVGRGTGKEFLAHRLSYELFVGPIPDGGQIRHTCRNRNCVNPEHLSLSVGRLT